MSNFTDFFPTPAAGAAEITNPDELPIHVHYATSTSNIGNAFYAKFAYAPTTQYDASSASNHLTGTNSNVNSYSAQATLTAGTEATLLNITSGSGYLCNVFLPPSDTGATSRTQRITIVVDGTTYTYEYDMSGLSSGAYTTLLWGFYSTGDYNNYNLGNDSTSVGLYGHGGIRLQSDKSLPSYTAPSGFASVRLYSAHDFYVLQLPKLRFESSLQVKALNESMYTTTGVQATAAALYYLDTEIANM